MAQIQLGFGWKISTYGSLDETQSWLKMWLQTTLFWRVKGAAICSVFALFLSVEKKLAHGWKISQLMAAFDLVPGWIFGKTWLQKSALIWLQNLHKIAAYMTCFLGWISAITWLKFRHIHGCSSSVFVGWNLGSLGCLNWWSLDYYFRPYLSCQVTCLLS